MNIETDEYLLRNFRKSPIYQTYLYPDLDLEKIVRDQFPQIMYIFLKNLAEGSTIMTENYVLQHDLVGELFTQVPYHEGILTLQAKLGGKFYRDHLEHMLRVMLLSHIVGDVLKLDKNKLLACTLAGLFHDIAYPLSKAKETIYNVFVALRRCYPSLPLEEIDKIIKICKEKELKHLGKETNHAILSSCAFKNFWNLENLIYGNLKNLGNEDLREIIRLTANAIATHDSEIERDVVYSKEPVSAILILADELQDWGRPVGDSRWIAIPNIEPFLISRKEIRATLDYSKSPEYYEETHDFFSPLFQIQSKQKNMSRLVLNADFPAMHLTYRLPPYRALFSKDLILSYVKQVERYENGLLDDVHELSPEFEGTDMTRDELLLSGAMESEIMVPSNLKQLKYYLFGVFYNRVAKSNLLLYLHYNWRTGEYVIHSDKRMPTEIVMYKNRKGNVEWNYEITGLEKAIKHPFKKYADLLDIPTRFDINIEEAIHNFKSINNSQVVESFVALLQLLPYIFLKTEKISLRRCEKAIDVSDEAIRAIKVLWHSYNNGCNYFRLDCKKKSLHHLRPFFRYVYPST